VKHEGQRRAIFLRYLGEVATAVSLINQADRAWLYERLLEVAKRHTTEADVELDDRGRPIDEAEEAFGDNVIIVEEPPQGDLPPTPQTAADANADEAAA
jgi:DNA topoisomerase-6 subunit B